MRSRRQFLADSVSFAGAALLTTGATANVSSPHTLEQRWLQDVLAGRHKGTLYASGSLETVVAAINSFIPCCTPQSIERALDGNFLGTRLGVYSGRYRNHPLMKHVAPQCSIGFGHFSLAWYFNLMQCQLDT